MKLRTFIGPDGEVAVPDVMVEIVGVDDDGRAIVRVGEDDLPLDAFLNEKGGRSIPRVFARVQAYNSDGSIELAEPQSGGGGGGGDASAANQVTEIAWLTAIQGIGTETHALADNIAMAAGAAGPTVTVARGGYFFFDAAFSGNSPSLKLQRLGADGTTWLDVVTRTASGSGDPIGVPNGSQLRVYNAGSGSLTAVSAVLG